MYKLVVIQESFILEEPSDFKEILNMMRGIGDK